MKMKCFALYFKNKSSYFIRRNSQNNASYSGINVCRRKKILLFMAMFEMLWQKLAVNPDACKGAKNWAMNPIKKLIISVFIS